MGVTWPARWDMAGVHNPHTPTTTTTMILLMGRRPRTVFWSCILLILANTTYSSDVTIISTEECMTKVVEFDVNYSDTLDAVELADFWDYLTTERCQTPTLQRVCHEKCSEIRLIDPRSLCRTFASIIVECAHQHHAQPQTPRPLPDRLSPQEQTYGHSTLFLVLAFVMVTMALTAGIVVYGQLRYQQQYDSQTVVKPAPTTDTMIEEGAPPLGATPRNSSSKYLRTLQQIEDDDDLVSKVSLTSSLVVFEHDDDDEESHVRPSTRFLARAVQESAWDEFHDDFSEADEGSILRTTK